MGLIDGIGTDLIHRKRVPTTFGYAEVDPKGKAYKNSDLLVLILKNVRFTAFKELTSKIYGDILAFPLGKGDHRSGG